MKQVLLKNPSRKKVLLKSIASNRGSPEAFSGVFVKENQLFFSGEAETENVNSIEIKIISHKNM